MDSFIEALLHDLRKVRMLRQQNREKDHELADREDDILTKMFLHYEEKNQERK